MKWDPNDALAGLILIAAGAFFVFKAGQYGLGTARHMGPGFFPMLIGVAAIGTGSAIALLSAYRRAGFIKPDWRPLIAVLLAILVFALTIRRFGLIPAVSLTAATSALGDSEARGLSTVLLVVAVSVLVWLIFVVALGVTIPVVRGLG